MVPVEWKGNKLSWTNKLKKADKGLIINELPDKRQRVLVAITRDGLKKDLDIEVLFHKLPTSTSASKWDMDYNDMKWAVTTLVKRGYMKLGR
jgi:hypothetical protein